MRKVFAEFEREKDRSLIENEEEKEKELTLEVALNPYIQRWNKPDIDNRVEGEGDGDSTVSISALSNDELQSPRVHSERVFRSIKH